MPWIIDTHTGDGGRRDDDDDDVAEYSGLHLGDSWEKLHTWNRTVLAVKPLKHKYAKIAQEFNSGTFMLGGQSRL